MLSNIDRYINIIDEEVKNSKNAGYCYRDPWVYGLYIDNDSHTLDGYTIVGINIKNNTTKLYGGVEYVIDLGGSFDDFKEGI